jgi:Icc protein
VSLPGSAYVVEVPIYLDPISRRSFLRRSLAGAAGLALSPRLLAGTRRTDADSWALLADTHLAADRSLIARGVNMTGHFQTVSGELLALPKRPAGVFIVGDCAYSSGEPGDYRTLVNLLDPIRADGTPVHLALGNHDQREHFWDVLQDQKALKRPLADRQVALLRTRRVNWFVLDSLESTNHTPGLLGQAQLDWLAKALDANPSRPALVLIHHNPGLSANLSPEKLIAGQSSQVVPGLIDTGPLFNVIRPRKQVKAYIFGHTHVWKIEQDPSGIHLINLPPVAYVFQEGNPSGWVHATLRSDGMQLKLHCVDTAHKANGQTVDLAWRT